MDFITHAIAGAAVGTHYGHPFIGALIGAAPDLPLGVGRKDKPNALYLITHSPVVVITAATLLPAWVILAWASHIALDAVTHSAAFSVRPFSPFSGWRIPWFREWEWFNSAWWLGAALALIWSVSWTIA